MLDYLKRLSPIPGLESQLRPIRPILNFHTLKKKYSEEDLLFRGMNISYEKDQNQ